MVEVMKVPQLVLMCNRRHCLKSGLVVVAIVPVLSWFDCLLGVVACVCVIVVFVVLVSFALDSHRIVGSLRIVVYMVLSFLFESVVYR